MSNYQTNRSRHFLILGAAIVAAAWMIGAPDVLQRFNWHPTIVEMLTWIPPMIVFFWSTSTHKKFLVCERKAFKKLLGLS